jgi:phytoene synthase
VDALLEGLAWDVQGRRYENLSQVYDYSARVAGSVGVMMALLMGVRAPELTARACDLGVAMQLTNIARDVGEDARAGRLYLPADWLREEGIDPDDWLERPRFDAALQRVVRRLLTAAERLYAQADLGIAGLPRDCRAGINAARFLYAEIGHQLERMGCDSVTHRAVVPAARKAELLPLILWTSAFPRRGAAQLELSETRFLVEAAADAGLPPEVLAQGSREPALAQIERRAVWVLELFERLERRDRMRRAAARQRVMEPLQG